MEAMFFVEAVLEDDAGGDVGRSRQTKKRKELKCPDCDQKFAFSSALKRHEVSHTGKRAFKCSYCPEHFTLKSNCVRHERRKHWTEAVKGKKAKTASPPQKISSYRCHLCEHSSTERPTALQHLKTCHFAEYNLLVSSGECDSGTEENESLIQEQEEKYPGYINRKVICSMCMHRFWFAEDLRRHMRTHTKERPFRCDLCLHDFPLKHNLARHIKLVHAPVLRCTENQ